LPWPCCSSCRFWKPQSRGYANFELDDEGVCTNQKLIHGKKRERIMINTSDVVLPELSTGADFGCVYHEQKK
jgi:translation initiation factor IF-1